MSKILIVEDDQHTVRLLQTLFSMEGHETFTTNAPGAVVDNVRQKRPDVVVMDLHLGKVQTVDILKTIKTDPALQATPVIIVSGMDAEEVCAQAGADAFVLKPYSPTVLLDKVKQLAR